MRTIILAFITIPIISCSNTEDTVITSEIPIEEPGDILTEEIMEETVEAVLIRKKAYNKAGKEMPYAGDFYLILNNEEVFVRILSSEVTSVDLEPLLDKKSKFLIRRSEGLWDTSNPEVQSRIGPYVSIIRIL
jgi:hypothetical protein